MKYAVTSLFFLGLFLTASGCGGASDTSSVTASDRVATQEESDAKAKELMKGMGGMYKGAPGAPKPKN